MAGAGQCLAPHTRPGGGGGGGGRGQPGGGWLGWGFGGPPCVGFGWNKAQWVPRIKAKRHFHRAFCKIPQFGRRSIRVPKRTNRMRWKRDDRVSGRLSTGVGGGFLEGGFSTREGGYRPWTKACEIAGFFARVLAPFPFSN